MNKILLAQLYMLKVILILAFFFPFFDASGTELTRLKTEYTDTPLGIDVESPRFSWQMKSDRAGAFQSAYQIVVIDEHGQQVWNTKKVLSDLSLNIRYEGIALKPRTRYYWYLTVWNEKKKKTSTSSWFETGLMQSGLDAWKGAKWIGGSDDDLVLYAHYLPVFRIDYTIKLDENSRSTKAGFIYGANDERLMNRNKNIFQLQQLKGQSYVAVELDIVPLDTGGQALLHVYRVGYHPNDKKEIPLRSFSIPFSLISKDSRYHKHRISITSNLGHTVLSINNTEVGKLGVNPIGQGGDFIAFPVVGEIGYQVSPEQQATFSDIVVRNFQSPSNTLASVEGQVVSGGGRGAWITFDPSRNVTPILRTSFDTKSQIKKARLYVSSRGIYDFYINGKRISENYFNPGMTQYTKTQLYQTYDVTEFLLNNTKNGMGAILAEGWWSGAATFMGEYWNFFGDRQSLLSKLVITYMDGSEQQVVSSPDTWKYFNDGPTVYGSFFQGEVYDARKELAIEAWSTATFNAERWVKAHEISLVETTALPVSDFEGIKLVGQIEPGVQKIKELMAKSVEEVRPGVFVYDMGQNMVGVPNIILKGLKEGQKINLRFAEVKYPDLPHYKNNIGMIMLENIRAAMSQDIYIAKGSAFEVIQPRFTFHGYRFIEITGIEQPLPLESVKGTVISSIHELASSYETSNQKVNKLWENITWSTYGNFLSIPTDCPQRNERLGWSGDISVFARSATYLAELPLFLRRHLRAMRDTQHENGRFADVAPLDVGFGGVLWGSAGITVPWEIYQQYGDKDMLEEHYESMKRYIDYILTETIEKETNLIVQRRAWSDLADWLGPEDGKNDKSLLWEAYFLYDLEIMQNISSILGKTDDTNRFAQLYRDRKSFFNKTYVQKEAGKTIFSAFDKNRRGRIVDTQTSYVLPLVFNLVEGQQLKEKMISQFVNTVEQERRSDNGSVLPAYSLMTGFIGTSWINKALSDNGFSDVAYRLLQQTSYPSWLYSVDQGSTTIWERLNSYTHTDGFGGNNQMNSFNHYSFGAVASWMYNHSLGIERDQRSPGFKHFILKPEVDPTREMTFAKGHYDAMYGRIESSWERKNEECVFNFVVPANTTATLYLAATSINKILNGYEPFSQMKSVKYKGEEYGKHIFEIPSGNYKLRVLD